MYETFRIQQWEGQCSALLEVIANAGHSLNKEDNYK